MVSPSVCPGSGRGHSGDRGLHQGMQPHCLQGAKPAAGYPAGSALRGVLSMMNDLQAAHALLNTAMLNHPAQTLANVVAWLDPVTLNREVGDGGDVNYDAYEEGDYFTPALEICRQCFPEVYTQTCQLMWQGADEYTLERHLISGINTHLVAPLEDLEQIGYGV